MKGHFIWLLLGVLLVSSGCEEGDGVPKQERKFVSLSMGGFHSCAIENTGALWCWGDNGVGQLGIGCKDSKNRPVQVGSENDWRQISCGDYSTCGVRDDRSVWCWGQNIYGWIGSEHQYIISFPQIIAWYDDKGYTYEMVAVSTSAPIDTCMLKQDHSLWCWGDNWFLHSYDACGEGFVCRSPLKIETPTSLESIAVGGIHACGKGLDKSLWCWGSNYHGELGNEEFDFLPSPLTRVESDNDWATVATGDDHTCAIKDDGRLFCFGSNQYGQLGVGENPSLQNGKPAQVGDTSDWIQVSSYDLHTCGIRRDGSLWCWGSNYSGALGINWEKVELEDVQWTPQQVGTDVQWQKVSSGNYHSCALMNDSIWCWGDNGYGQLGNGDTKNSLVPVEVSFSE